MRTALLLAILVTLAFPGTAPAADRCQQEKPDQASREAGCAEGCGADCADAAYYLEQGWDVPKDSARAARYYERACALEDKMSCLSLGRLFEKGGDGLKRDLGRAAALFETACQRGNKTACESQQHVLQIACREGDASACKQRKL